MVEVFRPSPGFGSAPVLEFRPVLERPPSSCRPSIFPEAQLPSAFIRLHTSVVSRWLNFAIIYRLIIWC
jgi:hypothetical protein